MHKIIILALCLIFLSTLLKAQEIQKPNDTLAIEVKKIKGDIDILKKIKLSGYVQAQYQISESKGIGSFEGGDFPVNTDNRFKVRRAEFKTMYDNSILQIVANIDNTQNGVNIKDAFGKFTEQRYKTISFTAGIFNRPFGFEVPYSSGLLETPERSRMIQTLFPGERDGGAMITFQRPSGSKLNPLKIEAGFFNGTGNNANDFDSQKDFIGNIHWNKTLKSEKFSYGLGTSFYNGGWANGTKYLYSMATLPNGSNGFMVDSAAENKFAISKRIYTGFDFQLGINWVAGLTILRGEFITGQQPGTANSSVSVNAQPLSDAYNRKFNGANFYFIQNILKTKHQFVLKYDWYDPNIQASGNEIGQAGTKLTAADIKYTTLGIGWVYKVNANIKFTVYYALVRNEITENIPALSSDLKDNVITLRTQFKF